MRYRDFIKEIRILLSDGQNLSNIQNTDQDPNFREWRNRLTSYILLIEQEGYKINCGIRYRSFGVGYANSSTRINQYNTELVDTLNELRLLIESFEKYSKPKKMRLEGKNIEDIPTISQILFSLKAHHGLFSLGILFLLILIILYIGSLLELEYDVNQKLLEIINWIVNL